MRVFFYFFLPTFEFITSIKSTHLYKYIILILYVITGALSNFGAIDILAPQWIYLGCINIIACFYFLFSSKSSVQESFHSLISSLYLKLYLFYIIWNGLSYFYAINPTETLINLPRLVNTFFAIFFCYFLLNEIPNKLYFVSRLFIIFLSLETLAYYNDFVNVYPTEGLSVSKIKGFAGNKNITAASIAFKIPFVLYLLNTVRSISFKFYLFIVLYLGSLSVSLIEARAAILSSLFVFVLFISFQVNQILKKEINLKQGIYSLLLIITPYFLSLFSNILITNTSSKGSITDTVGRIAFTEESSNGRFQYWGDAWDYIKENPIIASGLGNWKIASIGEGKEHISGYTVPYHAHNDFIHVFTETGILGGFAYLTLFIILTTYLLLLLYKKYKSKGFLELQYFFLLLPFIVYGLDAGLNFPVARPLMQSSLAIFVGLILGLYLDDQKIEIKRTIEYNIKQPKLALILILFLLIPSLAVHIISFKSLQKQGRLLYEFNNAQYNMTRQELDEISHDFPNLTETAMPIKAMKARYYYLQGNREEAHKMALKGIEDNPQIYFGENLKSLFFFQEGNIDSAFVYAKKAFEGLPNNMPHYDMYLKTLVAKKDYQGIDSTFERVRAMAGDTKVVWTIYIRALAQTRSLGDPHAMSKAAEAYALYPTDETIFTLYRILTYGQQRMVQAEQLSQQASKFYNEQNYLESAKIFAQAFELDPLQHTYSLNAGISQFSAQNFDEAIRYLALAQTSKKPDEIEKAIRYQALSNIGIGDSPKACALFLKLVSKYPKRMYQQEFKKYCRGGK